MKDWKVIELCEENSTLLIRRVGRPTHPGIGIRVEERDEWNGGTNGAEYYPTLEEIDALIVALTQIKSELQENK